MRLPAVPLLVLAMLLAAPGQAQPPRRSASGPFPDTVTPRPPLQAGALRWGAGIAGGAAGAAAGWYLGEWLARPRDSGPCRHPYSDCEVGPEVLQAIAPWVGATLVEALAVPLAVRAAGGGELRSALAPSLVHAVVGVTVGSLVYHLMDSPGLAFAFSGTVFLSQVHQVSSRLRR